jgi:ABC-type multidrug transport system ATPase subunit
MIRWTELTFNIKIRSHFKSYSFKILDNINEYFETNTLNAIMSPSGAGKTTLLKRLNGSQLNGLIEVSNIYILFNYSTNKCIFRNCKF